MENKDLKERYIYAVSKYLPTSIKKDVSDELSSIIQDMLDERCGDVLPSEHDIRVVLTELGTPRQLAQKYDEDRDKCLIGAPYYTMYKYILKIVGACVACAMPIAIIMGSIMSHDTWITILINTISGIVGGLLTSFAIVTIIFAVFYHKGIKMDNLYDSIDNLPPVPRQTKMIPRREPIFAIAISVIFAIIFMCFPQIIFAVFVENGVIVPVLNVDYIRATWYLVIIFSVLGIVRECVKLMDGLYTKRVMIVTIITDIFTGIFSCIWLANENIMNPDFRTAIVSLFDSDGVFVGDILKNINYMFLSIIMFALLIDIATTIFKTIRN